MIYILAARRTSAHAFTDYFIYIIYINYFEWKKLLLVLAIYYWEWKELLISISYLLLALETTFVLFNYQG